MKQNFYRKLIACLAAVFCIASLCTVQAEAASKGYIFKYKKVSVQMHGNATDFLKKAGKPISQKKSKSCAYSGLDATYIYKDMIVTTYSNSVNGTEYVNSITLRTDKVQTKEGIKLGSSYNDVVKKYGKGKENFGIYTYTKGKSKLQIEIEGDKVKKITYLAK